MGVRTPLFRRKIPKMGLHIGNFAEGQAGFAHIALKGAFSQIRLEGGVDRRLHFLDFSIQAVQHQLPKGKASGCAGAIIVPLGFHEGRKLH